MTSEDPKSRLTTPEANEMKSVECMSHALEELNGAKEYVTMAYAMKGHHPDLASKLREMARQEMQHGQNFFDMSQNSEQEHGDGYADKVAEYAECRATIKMMLDSM